MAFVKKYYLVILGLGTVLVLSYPGLGIIPMFSVIGIPLAFAYWAIPALFLTLVITHFFCALLPFKGIVNIFISLVACGLVLAAPAFLLNRQLSKQAHEIVANDHNNLYLPLLSKVIAVRRISRYRWSKGTIHCDGFCLHALLTGEANRVLVTKSREPENVLNLKEKVTAFSLLAGDNCPAIKFTPGHHRLNLLSGKNDFRRSVSAIEEMKLRISNGDCLISQSALLGDADMIISIQRLARSVRNAKLGFALNVQSISTDRITVHLPVHGGSDFEEKFRWTGVSYKPFAPLMIPAPLFGYGVELGMGWLRLDRKINIPNKYYERPDWVGFLTKTLGMKLALNGADTKTRILKKIENVLSENRPPSRSEWQVFSEYFDRTAIGRNTNMQKSDLDIAMRMLESPVFPAPPRLYNMSKFAAKSEPGANAIKLASLLLTRMENGQTWATDLGVTRKSSLSNLGLAIQWLPDEAIKPHFQQFMRVARISDVRVHAYRAFRKIGVFGERAVPQLLSLINSGLKGGKGFFRINSYQHPYIAGLSGMCIAGPAVKSALTPMLRLMNNNKLAMHSSLGDLTINALVRIGAEPDVLWPYYADANKNRTRKSFDHEVKRAQSTRPDCDY